MWIGIDDTDSPKGGCTTYVLTELIAEARERGIDLIGFPRLVRLNPNVPWKTRGNAALSARFGHGAGPSEAVGEVAGRPVRRFARGRPLNAAEGRAWVEAAWKVVRSHSRLGDPGTDPALVAVSRLLPASLYRATVQQVVSIGEAHRALRAAGAVTRHAGSARGLVGAAASVAWPARRRTFEVISYRAPARIGAPRSVNEDSVRAAQRRHPSLFLCYDERTRRLLVAPHTPCPILFGLRATSRKAVLDARREVDSEPVDRWLLFETNQGTGDHLLTLGSSELAARTSARITGSVVGPGSVLPGGHALFEITDARGRRFECIAYEPTKTLPRVARALDAGDRVVVWGSRGESPALRVEGIRILRWNPERGPVLPPRCLGCQRNAHSLGRQRGYRCRGCGRRWPPEAGRRRRVGAPLPVRTYHPTPSARRHLAPLGPTAGTDGFPLGRAV